jgi:hypothetical protein
VRTTTRRVSLTGGGRRAPPPDWRSTLSRVGAKGAAVPTMGALFSRSRGTTMRLRPTGLAPTNVSRVTTVTPPGDPRFRYRAFVMSARVMLVTLTVVMLMLRTYRSLTRYAGTYTSLGPSGNQPTPPPTPTLMLQLEPPTKATKAGAYTERATARPGTHAQPRPM